MEPTISERTAILGMIRKMESIQNRKIDNEQKKWEIILSLDLSINEINQIIFPGDKVSTIYDFDCHKDGIEEFESSFDTWKHYIEEIIERTLQCRNKVEADFELLMAYLEIVNLEDLEELMKENLEKIREINPLIYENLTRLYCLYEHFWGGLNPEKGIFDCIYQRAEVLKGHIKEWRWLFGELSDYRSKGVLYNILANWITFNLEYLEKDSGFKDYFDLDLIPEVTEDEVFVDLGGYVGDTVEDFIHVYSAKYKRIYTYEINSQNLELLKEKVKDYQDVVIKEKAVGEKKDVLYLDLTIGDASTTLSSEGEQEITVVSLDEDITERITWIKMDIEGSEQSALRGARKHIAEEKPKLTICTYHSNEDIWKIPMMVKEYNPTYKLYFRYNGQTVFPSEYVLFAL